MDNEGGIAVLNAMSCPHCSGPAPRGIAWRRPFVWSEWACPTCHAVVGYSSIRRSLGAAVYAVLAATLLVTIPLLASIPLALGLAWIVFWVFDAVELRKVGAAESIRDAL